MDLLERASERVASKRCGSPPFELAPHSVRSIAGKALPFHRRAGLAHHVCMLAPAAAAFSDELPRSGLNRYASRARPDVFFGVYQTGRSRELKRSGPSLRFPQKSPARPDLFWCMVSPAACFIPESTGEDRAEFFPVIALGSVRCRQVGQRNVGERGHARVEHPSEDKGCGKQLLGLQSLTRCRYPVRIIRLQTVH